VTPLLATTLCGIAFAQSGAGRQRHPSRTGWNSRNWWIWRGLGGLVVKGLSREPIEGNPPPRLYESASGMINSIGLQNIGVRAFVRDKLPALARLRTAVFANVFGYQVEDYVEVLRVLNDHQGTGRIRIETCRAPTRRTAASTFRATPALLAEVVSAAKRVATRPLIVKLSPNVSAIEPLARAAEESGADALSLVNTFISLAIDARTPALADCRGLRRPFRPGHQAHRPAPGVPGGACREDPGNRAGRDLHRRGRGRVSDRRRQRGSRWARRRSGTRAPPLRIAGELAAFLRRENIERAADLVGTLRMWTAGMTLWQTKGGPMSGDAAGGALWASARATS